MTIWLARTSEEAGPVAAATGGSYMLSPNTGCSQLRVWVDVGPWLLVAGVAEPAAAGKRQQRLGAVTAVLMQGT